MDTDNREKRWLFIADDGRHVTAGRHKDPTAEEIQRSADALDALGLAGWLVVSEGIYYSKGTLTLLMVRRVTKLDGDWSEAERLFKEFRAAAIRQPG